MKNCTKYLSAIKIRDIVGTPTVYDPLFAFTVYDLI